MLTRTKRDIGACWIHMLPDCLLLALCVCCCAVCAQFFVNEMTYPAEGQDGKPKRGYQASPEDTYYNLAQYYDVPTISFRCVAVVEVFVVQADVLWGPSLPILAAHGRLSHELDQAADGNTSAGTIDCILALSSFFCTSPDDHLCVCVSVLDPCACSASNNQQVCHIHSGRVWQGARL